VTIWALSDLHLSFAVDKPMNVFGEHWEDHSARIEENWRSRVSAEDTVLVAGDISWGMTFDEALPDLQWLDRLPGKKILIRGNHDYWWKRINWMRERVPDSITLLQNDSTEVEGRTICGCRGWSLPVEGTDSFEEDSRIFLRERGRLVLSLDSTREPKEPIVMIHFPPFLAGHMGRDFTDILKEKGVRTVVYGHLHDEDARRAFTGERDGIRYLFTSADGIGFSPARVE